MTPDFILEGIHSLKRSEDGLIPAPQLKTLQLELNVDNYRGYDEEGKLRTYSVEDEFRRAAGGAVRDMLESRFGAHNGAPLESLLINEDLLSGDDAWFRERVPILTVLRQSVDRASTFLIVRVSCS